MIWIPLTSEAQFIEIIEKSSVKPQVIFKHSTRCLMSSIAKKRLESKLQPAEFDFYYLDLLSYRSLSDKIAVNLEVFHESPQVLLIKRGNCVYEVSHSDISMEELIKQGLAA